MGIIINPTMQLLPIFLFIGLILIFATCGFINGWKTSLYFLIWNILFFISIILILAFGYNQIWNWIFDEIKQYFIQNDFITEEYLYDSTNQYFKSIIFILLSIAFLIFINLFALLFYLLIFRKRFKRQIKINKSNNKSNIWTRIIGSSIGVLTLLPTTIGIIQVSQILAPNFWFTNYYDKFSKIITFNQSGSFSELREAVRFAVLMKNNNNIKNIELLSKIVLGVEDTLVEKNVKQINDNLKNFQQILDSPFMNNFWKIIIKNIKTNLEEEKKEIKFDYEKLIKNIPKNLKTISIKKATKEKISQNIIDIFKTKNGQNELEIRIFIDKIFGVDSKVFKVSN